jgi:4-hydroxy-tetrahydrodipicolinate reductase
MITIALIGYGKMGRAIEKIAVSRGHRIGLKIDLENGSDLTAENLSKNDVAIEFTGPSSAPDNLRKCLAAGIPVVCGSTGWLKEFDSVKTAFEKKGTAFLYASNFSIGVNIFFELNKKLAELMGSHPEYKASLREIHHTQKKDAPSGTAITLAEQVMERIPSLKTWVNEPAHAATELSIISERIDPAPGIHEVIYSSAIDDLEIRHTAHNREGFAGGAVLAAEYIYNKKGIFTMKDVLGFE